MKKICPSILAADFTKLGEEIRDIEEAGADIIHCDIMDGHFVPNISYGPEIVSQVNEITSMPLDVHLMINDPQLYIEEFYKAGADYISVHYENNYHVNRLVNQIKELGAKAGVVLNPATPVEVLEDILEYADFILLMSVNPGFGGQKFIPNVIDKVRKLKQMISERNLNCMIEIDGGVGLNNIGEISKAGVDMFVCGSSIFREPDRKQVIARMRELIS
ncbi:MAG: ribulose-phosphate 3-epimerase [Ignavibacteriae bacterium]|nr:ribulose-phosphate 3-epimerase [Ignavibacteriota bacterium]MCB9243142.1 ribulose-phosphate 3-epimerase [Ignavibacteriales bacterium]